MSFSIQTNINSLIAQENLRVNSNFQSSTIQELTSGYRINQSGDDAAGLAMANTYRSEEAELTQGVRNANDGISTLQIADGGMSNISQMLDRLRTLAAQSSSDTFSDAGRVTDNSEFQTLLGEIDREAQAIGLDTNGQFAKSLQVFVGGGSAAGTGGSSISNGTVTLDLGGSACDTQALGLRGMEVVNISGALNGTNSGTDIGPSAGLNSVQNIVASTTGNQMATTGNALFLFSGAGFSDASQVAVSVNLSGVTDVTTLASALNAAIQNAGNGSTSAATAFKNANIVASVHTDSAGGQELAFSSSSAAFQVQAGDQMANALLGNVTNGVGTAVNTSTVTGQTTQASGTFATPDHVHMVITGGGLANPVTLQLGSSSTSISAAISDFENQFASNQALVNAGLTMSGSTTPGAGALSFNSSNGQAFNIQVTGDTANLLGLGSFLTDNSGDADYDTLTAGAAYSDTADAGTANLEISLNGGASTALTGINLSSGAHAAVASTTGTAVGTPAAITGFVGGGGDTVTIVSTGSTHTFATQTAITLTATQAATSGLQAGTLASGGITYGAALNGLTIQLKINNVAQTVTLAGGGADSSSTLLLSDLNGQLGQWGAHAYFDAGNGGLLTIASNSVGSGNNSSIQITGGTGLAALGFSATGQHSGTDASASLQDIAGEIQAALGANAAVSVVGGNQLQIATVNKGAGEFFKITADAGAGANLGLTTSGTTVYAGQSSSIQDIVDNLNAQFANSTTWQAAGLQAVATTSNGTPGGNYVTIKSTNGTQFRLNSLATGADIGYGNTGVTFTGATPTSTTAMSTLQAQGVSNTGPLAFTAMQYGGNAQTLTISAGDNTGNLESTTITLQNNGSSDSGASIDSAVAYINQQLQQQTNQPALQQIVAVKEVHGGAESINFISSLSSFSVGVSGCGNSSGVKNGTAATEASTANGSAATMSIDTQAGAMQAVTAIATAVQLLGSAQAAVGKSENQLNYAIGLAESQYDNFSAAESRIRDADVAAEASDLTKAQVLQQASIAAMAQANSAPQAVLALLRS